MRKIYFLWILLCLLSIHTMGQSACWLSASGTRIVNSSSGQPVVLRAVGLGDWALQEGYMLNPQGCSGCPGTQWQMKLQYYNEGQSEAQVEAFYQSWRDQFITKADIDYIASLGFNSVRLPMHYELFLTDAQRSVRNAVITDINYGHDTYKNSLQTWLDNAQLFTDSNLEGFRMIDNLISWCASNDMYVILDLHAAPGGQGSDKNIADIFHDNNLWQFPVFQDVTNLLWDKISERYMTEPRIAFYDLINETNNVPGGGPVIHDLLQRFITTIRNNGDNHMLMVEGNGWGNNYDYLEPYTFSPNWGLVYNAHRYWIDPADDWIADSNPNQINRMINLLAFRDTYNVPVWVGETGENTNEWLRQNIVKLEAEGIGWCHWTYKRHDVYENAALMRIGGNYPTDGATAMSTVLESIKFANCIPNANTIAAVTQDLPAVGTSGCNGVSSVAEVPTGETIWLRGNNDLYVSSENGEAAMMCDRTSVQGWEQFTVELLADGKVALLGSNGLYVSSENGESAMVCDRASVGGWEAFDWVSLGDHHVALRGFNDLYVSSENGESGMMCNRTSISAWETFVWGTGSASRAVDSSLLTELDDVSATIIYPNPTKSLLKVDLRSLGFAKADMKVTDLSGRLIYEQVLEYDVSEIALPNGWGSGVYFISLSSEGRKYFRRLIIE